MKTADLENLKAKFIADNTRLGVVEAALDFPPQFCKSPNAVFEWLIRELYYYAEQARKDAWISVKDRLPEVTNVIVAYKFGVGECKYVNGRFVLLSDWSTEIPEVTHWMPLPDFPKTTNQ